MGGAQRGDLGRRVAELAENLVGVLTEQRRIPCFTSLDTARAAVESLRGPGAYSVRRRSEYLDGS